MLNVSNPDRQDMWTVTADKNLHIVMENHQHNYYFLFVKKDYNAEPSWVGITWSNFTGTAMTSTNALYLHRHITLNAPEMLENPDTYIRMTDFYSGEGPNAITTNNMAILQPEDNDVMRLGHASVSDDGRIRFGEMTFTPGSGKYNWDPPEYNRIMGEMITLPPRPVPDVVRS